MTKLTLTLTDELEAAFDVAAGHSGKVPEEFARDILRAALVKEMPSTNGAKNPADYKNLAEYLGDFIGSVKGLDPTLSQEAGRKFGDLLAEKHERRQQS